MGLENLSLVVIPANAGTTVRGWVVREFLG
jgi:hypothetical protein